MIEDFGSDVDFLTAYIAEAHPRGGWEAPDQPYEVEKAKSTTQRLETALNFFAEVSPASLLAVDTISNQAALDFAAMPDRIFVINSEKRFVYVQPRGPPGYQPDELRSFLEARFAVQ